MYPRMYPAPIYYKGKHGPIEFLYFLFSRFLRAVIWTGESGAKPKELACRGNRTRVYRAERCGNTGYLNGVTHVLHTIKVDDMKKWASVAKWPYPDVNLMSGDNSSVDYHDTKEQALAVIRMLKKDGFGGGGRLFPIEVFVQEVKP